MATETQRRGWSLKSFLDSLTLELDRAQETLALKGLTRRLTYTVQDLALDLQLFPDFDGEDLRFTTARPGETGAARVSLQLGSITDRQIRESTKEPPRTDDISIDLVEDMDPQVKSSLKKVGVSSVRDLETMEQQNIDIGKATNSKIDYGSLARMINRSKRLKSPPRVTGASLDDDEQGSVLTITGENLADHAHAPEFPRAFLGDRELAIRSASPTAIAFSVVDPPSSGEPVTLQIALDPYAVLRVNLAT